MSEIKTVGVVGLGLIGGSMVKTIKSKTQCIVYGIDLSKETMALAEMSGSIDGPLTRERIKDCDLVMIAITPLALINWVKENAQYFRKDSMLVDLCGVKRVVMDEIEQIAKDNGFIYVGGHPMAGKEVAGFKNASDHLYGNASMILCPPTGTDIHIMDTLKTFYKKIGFRTIVFSDKAEHDRIIAYTSQLAHVTSSAYIKSPTSRSYMGFSAGSYRDMTRVARLDPDMWTELFLDNADNLEVELNELIGNLQDYYNAIHNRDKDKLHELLNEGLEIKLNQRGEKSFKENK
ncbi:MAG: prephenate dehydrogenase [Oscillospiraceae bacterium]|nr:prephenate dehydrogenase [Oscillospiraceae bacterium]